MRFSLILAVLLASANARAQGIPEIVTPTKNGMAEGISTYTSRDGTRVEITWRQGRKHGPFRKVTAGGAVLEEGKYFFGQRDGEWKQFDDAGGEVSSGRYILGVPHGEHKRFGEVDNKRQLVESTTYVLGLKHGPALVNKRIVGGLAWGAYAWDALHGTFRSKNAVTRFFCGTREPQSIGRRYMGKVCDPHAKIQHYVPSAHDSVSGKNDFTTAQTKEFCEGQAVLKIPVVINDEPLRCPKTVRFIQKKRNYARFVRDLYSAENVISEVQATIVYGDYHTAYFTQTVRRGGRRGKTYRMFGRLDMYEEGLVEWLFDSEKQCDFSVRHTMDHVVAVNPRTKVQATKPIADFILTPVTALALSDEKIFETYKAEFTDRESKDFVVSLVPRKPHSRIESVAARIAINDRGRRLSLKSVEVRMHNGDTVLTELRGMSFSERPDKFETNGNTMLVSGWENFKVVPANKLGCKRQRW